MLERESKLFKRLNDSAMPLFSSVVHETYEIDTNGGNVGFSVRIVCEPEQQTRLSDTGVSN